MLGEEYFGFHDGPSLNRPDDFGSGLRLGDQPGMGGGRRLGDIDDDAPTGSWDYRTLPNKSLELVKNTGDMHQEGTGYFVDSEAEMIKVLAYLNYGETTGTTESMREQIDEAVKNLDNLHLSERDEVEKKSFININF